MSVVSIKNLLVPTAVVQVPVVAERVPAGWPSPAEDYLDGSVDLNAHLIPRPAATYIVRAGGWSMRDVGISDGDELVVDRSLTARHGHVVIAVLDGEFVVKRLILTGPGAPKLAAANSDYPDLPVTGEVTIWGVVTYCLHRL